MFANGYMCVKELFMDWDNFLQDPNLLEALTESRKRQAPYAGAFLVKDDPESASVSGSETEKSIFDLKGKDLLNRLHEVGTLAQVYGFVETLWLITSIYLSKKLLKLYPIL